MRSVVWKWFRAGIIVYAGATMAWDLIAYARFDQPIGDFQVYMIAALTFVSAVHFAASLFQPESARP